MGKIHGEETKEENSVFFMLLSLNIISRDLSFYLYLSVTHLFKLCSIPQFLLIDFVINKHIENLNLGAIMNNDACIF
jgi:hypothetical protein